MIRIVEYEEENGNHPFLNWVSNLNTQAKLKIRTSISRIEHGNFSNVKAVGRGVSEYKVDFGPGYRIYFGKDGDKLVILLAGGTKKRQSRDIEAAQVYWKDYKRRKRKER